jgi:methylase of polypeptide subunit release factors
MSRFLTKDPKGFLEQSGIDKKSSFNVIELGGGTGIVGISFAQMFTQSKVTLTEMSEGCLKIMG